MKEGSILPCLCLSWNSQNAKNKIRIRFKNRFRLSHKKQKNSVEDSLDWVLLVTEIEFLMILVPRIPQNTSSKTIEYAQKSK